MPQLVDILNCPKGCNCGTATPNDIEQDDIGYITNLMKTKFIEQTSPYAIKSGSGSPNKVTKDDISHPLYTMFEQANLLYDPSYGLINPLFELFEEQLKMEDFIRKYTDKSATHRHAASNTKFSPAELAERIESIYNQLGKYTEEQRNYDCGACGFKTCKNFATSVAEERALVNACYFYYQHKFKVIVEDITATLYDNLTKTEAKLNAIDDNQAVLHDIARNINLISINAYIEAAAAGTYGRGFTVVASEIKKLADKSKGVTISTSKSNNEVKEQLEILKTELNKILQLSTID